MSFNENLKSELERILSSMGTDAFDADAKQRLQTLVSESKEARRLYLEHCQMHAMLQQSSLLSTFNAEVTSPKPRLPIPSRRSLAIWSGLTAAACAMFFFGVNAEKYFQDDQEEAGPRIAYVQNIDGIAWFEESGLTEGANVSLGMIRVESGSMTLRFLGGTSLLIQGPTELSIDSDMQVSLKQGKVAARVSQEMQGFTILGPDSAVVDLGTEFAMAVENGESWVQVYEGEVDISLLNEDGHAWKSRSLLASGPVRIDTSNGRIFDDKPPVKLPRFLDFPMDGLNVSRSYVDVVLESEPVHYWRFEESSDGQVVDHVGDGVAFLKGEAQIQNGGLYLPPGLLDRPPGQRNHGFASIRKPSILLTNNEFTIEAWVKPRFYQRRSLIEIGYTSPGGDLKMALYSLTLVPSQQQTVIPSETFRFNAHLWPYGELGEVSTFSAKRYVPYSWQHVVAVRRHDRIEIYLNGRPAQAVPTPPISSDYPPTRISIGMGDYYIGARRRSGFFKGLVDEVAIYPEALPAEEIWEHYQAMPVQ